MALRGLRPGPGELERVRRDPAELPAIIEGYLESPQFGATMRELHNEALLTLANLPLEATDELADTPTARMQRSLGEEPLRLIEHVITSDRPYSEIVTADYTVADAIVATAHGLPYDPAGDVWQVTRYPDGRPATGVLATNAFLARHKSVGANWHRGRANAASRALLCYDFLDRDVDLDTSIDLSDPQVVKDAVVANPSCASCHQNLDPLASYFWGYRQNFVAAALARNIGYPLVDVFLAARTDLWQRRSERPPGYFGYGTGDYSDLGQRIASDPRFTLCAATRFYSFFHQVPLDEVPLAEASALQQLFIESGLSAKALARAVVLSDAFRASHATDEAEADSVIGIKRARPEQLARLIHQLTGFRWRTDSARRFRGGALGRVDLLLEDQVGFRVLAGGIDGDTVVTPSHTFNATSTLVLEELAYAAAGFVVDRDLAEPDHGKRRLLGKVDPDTVEEPQIRAQLVAVVERVHGDVRAPDDDVIELAYQLFAGSLERSGDPAHAWKTTIAALLQDVRTATY